MVTYPGTLGTSWLVLPPSCRLAWIVGERVAYVLVKGWVTNREKTLLAPLYLGGGNGGAGGGAGGGTDGRRGF